jgi:hypothetical protein
MYFHVINDTLFCLDHRSNAGQAAVTIAGTTCTVSSISNTEIVCVTGQHTPSQKTSVTVEINGNGVADQV